MQVLITYRLLFRVGLSLVLTIVCAGFVFALSNDPTGGSIPFTQKDGFILIEGKVDGQHGLFILDTGTDELFLHGDQPREAGTAFQQAVGDVEAGQRSVKELRLAHRVWTDLHAYVLDLSHLEDQLEREILGIVGISFVLPHTVFIDYVNNRIDVNQPLAKSIDLEDGYRLVAQLPIEFQGGSLPVIECEVGGETLRLGIDSGAGHNLLFGRKALKLGEVRRDSKSKISLPDGRVRTLRTVQPHQLELGRVSIRASSFLVLRSTQLRSQLDGLINLNLLGFDKFVIDTKLGKVLLFARVS